MDSVKKTRMKNIIVIMMKINKMKYKNCKYYTTKDSIMLIKVLANLIDEMRSGNDK